MSSECLYKLELDVTKTCRICLFQKEILTNIYSACIVEGSILALPKIIYECLDIELDELNDKYPRKICDPCKLQVINFYTFKEKSQKTNKALTKAIGWPVKHEIFDHKDDILDTKEESEIIIDQATESLVEIIDDDYEQETIPVNNNTNNFVIVEDIIVTSLQKAERTSLPSTSMLVRSKKLESKFVQKVTNSQYNELHAAAVIKLQRQLGDDEQDEEDIEEDIISNDDDDYLKELTQDYSDSETDMILDVRVESGRKKKFSCSTCQRKFKTAVLRNQHVVMHEVVRIIVEASKFYPCPHCKTFFIDENTLQGHCNENHTNETTCTDYQFLEDLDGETTTKNDVGDQNPLKCGVCVKEFILDKDIKNHLMSHWQTFLCPYEGCGLTYNSFGRLSVHMTQRHFGQRKCVHCNQDNFESYYKLMEHRKNDCTGKTIECNHCGKYFVGFLIYNIHIFLLFS